MPEPTAPAPPPALGRQASAISQLVVKTMTDFTGRGPANARTSIGRGVVTVVLDDPLSAGERGLVNRGHGEAVMLVRRAVQSSMRDDLVAGVEAITGRTVLAFMSNSHVDPDLATEVFVLDPA